MNPWNLTEKEEQAMRLLIEHGSQKVVAMEMGYSKGHLSKILTTAADKLGEPTHIRAVLTFDRWEHRQ